MSHTSTQIAPPPQPLVALTDDEILFRDNVRQFADQALRPKVREMDEKGVFDRELIDQFFHLGLMGIEVPEQYGGGRGNMFYGVQACDGNFSRRPSFLGAVVIQ